MGSSESKMSSPVAVKPEPSVRKSHVSHLIDPRSPSGGIHRTPIQVDGSVSRTSAQSEAPPAFTDPRSPSVGIARTPVREVMRATVDSLARRLGMIFQHEAENKTKERPQRFSDMVEEEEEEEEEVKDEEGASSRPLLTPQRELTSLDSPLQSGEDLSHDVVVGQPQVEVEVESEVDVIGLEEEEEEEEEAAESPVHKRLSLSLITYHDGAISSHVFAEVHRQDVEEEDHCYALRPEPQRLAEPPVTVGEESPPTQPEEEEEEKSSSPTQPEEEEEEQSPSPPPPSEPSPAPSPEQPQPPAGIRCPTFDPRSPSQVVFKPQWLGRGFGAGGVKAKRSAGRGGKGGASPLAVRLAVKNAANENRGAGGKMKQKGGEGRSPLQILKDTNSPKEQRAQKKTKVSTPDRSRGGQTDRRVLAVSLNKEN